MILAKFGNEREAAKAAALLFGRFGWTWSGLDGERRRFTPGEKEILAVFRGLLRDPDLEENSWISTGRLRVFSDGTCAVELSGRAKPRDEVEP